MSLSTVQSEHKPAAAVEGLIRFDAAVLERHFDMLFFRKQIHVLVWPLGVVARSQQAFELQNGKVRAAQFDVQLRTLMVVPQPIEQHPVLLDCVAFIAKRFQLAHAFLPMQKNCKLQSVDHLFSPYRGQELARPDQIARTRAFSN